MQKIERANAMTNQNQEREIYIVISQTGAIMSRILKGVTKAEYNHVSLSLDKRLRTMYSFGRLHAYNPWIGGFVMESPHWGTFKRFQKTQAIVMSVPVTEEQYEAMDAFLQQMYSEKQKYHYNYLGVMLALFSVVYRNENCYYCSEFVRDTLDRFEVVDAECFEQIVKPQDFLSVCGENVVFSGKLQNYAKQYA